MLRDWAASLNTDTGHHGLHEDKTHVVVDDLIPHLQIELENQMGAVAIQPSSASTCSGNPKLSASAAQAA